MNFNRIITAAALTLLPVAVSAASFIVPAAGSGAGAGDGTWQTELTLHSTSSKPLHATLIFHDQNGAAETADIDLLPRGTLSLPDVVKTRFNRDNVVGAIEIVIDDAVARKLVVTSRTFNTSSKGEFGQGIPAVRASNATHAGKSVIISGPSSAQSTRLNVGAYAVSDSSVRWQLIRADSSIVATRTESYGAGVKADYNEIAASFFALSARDNDTIAATVLSGDVIAYGSIVAEPTGDPTYVAAVEADSDIRIHFLGVNYNFEPGVDIADADNDGVLDAPLRIYSSAWANSFQLLLADGGSYRAQFEILNPSDDVALHPNGWVYWHSSHAAGQTGELRVRVTLDGVSDVITIPVIFK